MQLLQVGYQFFSVANSSFSFFLFQVLLPAASLLQLMDVRKNCCDFLQSQLHPTNCLGIRAFADVHACTELLQQANAYAGEQKVIHPLVELNLLAGTATCSNMFILVSSCF